MRHLKEFPGAEPSYHSAAGYGGRHVLMEAIRERAVAMARRSGRPS